MECICFDVDLSYPTTLTVECISTPGWFKYWRGIRETRELKKYNSFNGHTWYELGSEDKVLSIVQTEFVHKLRNWFKTALRNHLRLMIDEFIRDNNLDRFRTKIMTMPFANSWLNKIKHTLNYYPASDMLSIRIEMRMLLGEMGEDGKINSA